jgi:glycosyltransferase involved in cell wall biosynthesis
MRVLMTNHTLDGLWGSESYTYSVATALLRAGHAPICFSPRLGRMAQHLRDAGVEVTQDLATLEEPVDVIHAHHRHEALLAQARFPSVPLVLVAHGVLPWQEHPLRGFAGADLVVAVSEEVAASLLEQHGLDPRRLWLVRNGVDLERFRAPPPAFPPRRLLALSNKLRPEGLAVLEQVCSERGLELSVCGSARGAPRFDVEAALAEADVVVTLGRGVLEATACGRPVIVFDQAGGDGLLTPECFEVFRRRNFSGRTGKLPLTAAVLGAELGRLAEANPEALRARVAQEQSVEQVTEQLLAAYREAAARRAQRTGDRSLVHGIAELAFDYSRERETSALAHAALQAQEAQARAAEQQLRVVAKERDEAAAGVSRERLRAEQVEGALAACRAQTESWGQRALAAEALVQESEQRAQAAAQREQELSEQLLSAAARGEALRRELQATQQGALELRLRWIQLEGALLIRLSRWLWRKRDALLPEGTWGRRLYAAAVARLKRDAPARPVAEATAPSLPGARR